MDGDPLAAVDPFIAAALRDEYERQETSINLIASENVPSAAEAFREIADEVGARLLADVAHPGGLIAAGLHPSPAGLADFVTTSTHETLRGPSGGLILCNAREATAINRAVMPGIQSGPHMHVIATKAVAFAEAATPESVQSTRALSIWHGGFPLNLGTPTTHGGGR